MVSPMAQKTNQQKAPICKTEAQQQPYPKVPFPLWKKGNVFKGKKYLISIPSGSEPILFSKVTHLLKITCSRRCIFKRLEEIDTVNYNNSINKYTILLLKPKQYKIINVNSFLSTFSESDAHFTLGAYLD